MTAPTMTTPNPTVEILPPERPRSRVRRVLVVTAVAVAAGLAGAFASTAYSQGFGPPWQHRLFWGQTFDPAAIEDRADRMVRHLAVEVDATAEMNSRARGRELLTQTTIDRAAIEALRGDQMALADQASRRVAQAIGDAASVLTPEQRRKISERMEAWHAFRRGWHRG